MSILRDSAVLMVAMASSIEMAYKKNSDFFLTLILHSDGVPLYKSKICSAWPILGAVVDLPPYARTKADNILLLGLWISRKKPNFHVILEKLSKILLKLKNVGLQMPKSNNIKIFLPLLVGDMPALSDMVEFVDHTAYYACMFCDTKGVYCHNGHCAIYPNDSQSELRTEKSFDRCALLAASNSRKRDETAGVKGFSAFRHILDVPLPHSLCIDGMHTVFLCHGRKLLVLYQAILSKVNVQYITEKLRSLRYILDIQGRPRGFSSVHKWKASEVRVFILFIGLPVLCHALPEDLFGDFAMYVVIQRLLHDQWRNSPPDSPRSLGHFVIDDTNSPPDSPRSLGHFVIDDTKQLYDMNILTDSVLCTQLRTVLLDK
ncbi:unnamed protein product, partial [Didymodactylos carnosus]